VDHLEVDVKHNGGEAERSASGGWAGRRGGFLVVLAEHAQHGRRGRVLAFLLAGGDDEPGGDVAQAQALAAEVDGDGEHGVVGDGGAPDGLAAGAGGLVAFQVRSRMYSRSIPDSAARTVNTTPAGSCEPCSSPVRNSSPMPAAFTQVKQPGNGRDLDLDTRTRNALLRSLRCLGERAFALLTQRWRTLQRITASAAKITGIARAALVLTHFEHGYLK